MSSGTSIIENALQHLKAHSPLSPANPESILVGKDVLNGFIAELQDATPPVEMGIVPLKSPGDELSEPLGSRNAIVFNLAVLLQPSFPGTQISLELGANARRTLAQLKRTWRTTVIPKQKVRGTLPKGAGNRWCNDATDKIFFDVGDDLG